MKEEPARGRAGVDCVRQAPELHALLMQFACQINQLLDAATQAIELLHHQRVALTQHFPRLGQTRTLSSRTADLILEDLLAHGLSQRFVLQVKVLVLRREAGVAKQHRDAFLLKTRWYRAYQE